MMPLRVEGHSAYVMAVDGQPAEPFPARDGVVVLGPGNRIDLFIDAALAPGTKAPFLTLIDGNIASGAYFLRRGRAGPDRATSARRILAAERIAPANEFCRRDQGGGCDRRQN